MLAPTKSELETLYNIHSDRTIAEHFEVSTSTVRRWRRHHKIPSRPRGPRGANKPRISNDDLTEAVRKCASVSSVLRMFGLSDAGTQHASMRDRIRGLGLDTSHFGHSECVVGRLGSRLNHAEIFRYGSSHTTSTLRRIIKRDVLLDEKCVLCNGETVWMNKPLTLQIDHIDGDKHNNQLENLRFVCPNCHSQTPTFAGRNKGHH